MEYIYIYIYIYVCVCACKGNNKRNYSCKRNKKKNNKRQNRTMSWYNIKLNSQYTWSNLPMIFILL